MSLSRRRTLTLGGSLIIATSNAALAQSDPLAGLRMTKGPHFLASESEFAGRRCLKVTLTDVRQKSAAPQRTVAAVAVLPTDLQNGTVEADVAGVVNGRGDPDSRGFVGLAFHVTDDAEAYQAVYLRMTNGMLMSPPPSAPRNIRAVQYIAHPDWHFEPLRKAAPDVYEKAASVAPGRWFRLKLDVTGSTVKAYVDNTLVLSVDSMKDFRGNGKVGLFVDDGTDAYFANLKVTLAS